MIDDLDALADAYVASRTTVVAKKSIPPGASVGPGYYKRQFNWQISQKYPLLLYCRVCFWGSTNPQYRFCPYTHGEMADISGYFAELLDDV